MLYKRFGIIKDYETLSFKSIKTVLRVPERKSSRTKQNKAAYIFINKLVTTLHLQPKRAIFNYYIITKKYLPYLQ